MEILLPSRNKTAENVTARMVLSGSLRRAYDVPSQVTTTTTMSAAMRQERSAMATARSSHVSGSLGS